MNPQRQPNFCRFGVSNLLVPQSETQHSAKTKKPLIWRWILGISLGVLLVTGIAAFMISRAEPILRARVIETLSTRFQGPVILDEFHVSLFQGLQVEGKGLKIYGENDPNPHLPGVQPLITIAEFRFQTGVLQLLRTPSKVDTVYMKGLQINLPPKGQREAGKKHKKEKIRIYVAHFVCEDAQLVVNTPNPDKLPLLFDIKSLKMEDIGPHEPLRFEANLTNPKPVGIIVSKGVFGPWNADDPRDTRVNGKYTFDKADLGTIKGIRGILSSTGQYAGTLDRIVVDGATDTPDFSLASTGQPVALHTDFHAIVDGTSGDTYLQPVKATVLRSLIVATGAVVKTKASKGRYIQLDVTISKGRMEDLLKLGVKTKPPIMTGMVSLKTKLDLPPSDEDVANRLRLAGSFRVWQAHFNNEKVQKKVDELSLRSQGKPKLAKDDIPDNIRSDLSGTFTLKKAVLSFSQLHFQAPGTFVSLTGKYSLDGNQFDFHGKARLEAKLSHLVTGWKSLLLKPVDPFFHKHGAGTEVAIKITGTKSAPHFGLDLGRKD
jgi:hypothetical protein